jgi:hypothetical protein
MICASVPTVFINYDTLRLIAAMRANRSVEWERYANINCKRMLSYRLVSLYYVVQYADQTESIFSTSCMFNIFYRLIQSRFFTEFSNLERKWLRSMLNQSYISDPNAIQPFKVN